FLLGGQGNDYLEGGAGLDIYEYGAETRDPPPGTEEPPLVRNGGNDEIRDTDGRGLIRYTFTENGTPRTTIAGGVGIKTSGTQWQSSDGKFTYEQQGSDLLLSINGDAGGSMLIRNFDFAKAQQEGYFGIRLLDAPAAPVTAREIEGDLAIAEFRSDLTPIAESGFSPAGQLTPVLF